MIFVNNKKALIFTQCLNLQLLLLDHPMILVRSFITEGNLHLFYLISINY